MYKHWNIRSNFQLFLQWSTKIKTSTNINNSLTVTFKQHFTNVSWTRVLIVYIHNSVCGLREKEMHGSWDLLKAFPPSANISQGARVHSDPHPWFTAAQNVNKVFHIFIRLSLQELLSLSDLCSLSLF